MKFTHVVVKEGNGKPSNEQIESAAMVKNAGQVFAIVATFKDDAKASILIDSKTAKDIEEHAESHGFEIHKLEEPENGEPAKPGEKLEESNLGEYRLTQTAIDLLESFAASEHASVRLMSEVLKAEMQTAIQENSMSIKVISERNLDNKTIRKNASGTSIEVAIAESEDNALQITEQGLKVAKPNTIELTSLGGEKIGEVIVY